MRHIKGGYALALLLDVAALALFYASFVVAGPLVLYCGLVAMLFALPAIGLTRASPRLIGILLASASLARLLVHFFDLGK